MSSDKAKSGIIEIRDVLKNEFQRFASINTVLKDTSDGFDKIDDTYSTYSSEMDVAKNHIIKLKRREFFENLFIYIGLIFFFACVAYVWLKRFPLHKIIYLIVNLLTFLINTTTSVVYSLMGDNKSVNATVSDLITQINNTVDFSNFTEFNKTYNINTEL